MVVTMTERFIERATCAAILIGMIIVAILDAPL